MAKFSKSSKARLATCHPLIINLFDVVIQHFDCTILFGVRSSDEQFELYKQGRRMNGEGVWVIEDKLKVVTYKDGYRKQSKHNTVPSQAIDVVSYPISWTDDNQAFYFSGHVMGIAKMMGINIRYGGDFNRNNQVSDEGFSDRYHFEIIED